MSLTPFLDGLFMTVGCHPTRSSEFESHPDGPEGYFDALKAYLDNPETKGKVVAIGECGLGKDLLSKISLLCRCHYGPYIVLLTTYELYVFLH